MSRRLLCFAVLIQLVSAFWVTNLRAENRALLIGVSGYPKKVGALRGPANDIGVMWRLLTERGFSKTSIRVLADGLPEPLANTASVSCADGTTGQGCPTYTNITRALEDLTATAKAGDYVILFFSGHGVQIPDLIHRDEPDGLTEAFVPIDVGQWQQKSFTVENLLTDDVVGAAIEALRKKGAFVWAIFDTCHAGDMVRGATDYYAVRQIGARSLGVPESAFAEARKGSPAVGDQQKRVSSINLLKFGNPDRLVGFYAAQSDQLALEFGFPDPSGQTVVMGAFTNALRRALARNPNATYRQVAQQISDIYSTFGTRMPVPYFEGDLDKAVFSDKASDPTWVASWVGNKIAIQAGELDGLSEGAIIGLFRSDSMEQVAGYARVEQVSPFRSEATPVTHDGRAPPPAASDLVRARLVQSGIRAMLRIAAPPAIDRTSPNATKALAAFDKLRAKPTAGQGPLLDWVEDGSPADVHLRLKQGQVWLLTQHGEWRDAGPRRSPSIEIAEVDATAQALQVSLWRAARALNLQRVVTSYRQSTLGGDTTVAKSLKVDMYVHRPTATAPHPECPANPTDSSVPNGARRIAVDDLPQLSHCDLIYVVMKNEGTSPIDVTLLYVDAEAGVQCMTPGSARFAPGERERTRVVRILSVDRKTGDALPVGRERFIVIAVEKPPGDAFETTFCHLQQRSPGEARNAVTSHRGKTTALSALMDRAGLAIDQSRNWEAVPDTEAALHSFAWEVNESKPR